MSDHRALRILLLTYISPTEPFGAGQRTQLLTEALSSHGPVDVLFLRLGQPGGRHGAVTITASPTGREIELCIARRGLSSLPRFDVPSSYVTRAVRRCVDLDSYDLIVSRYVKPALKLRLPASVPLVVDFDDAVFAPPWSVLTTAKMRAGAILRLLNDRVIARCRLRYQARPLARFLFCRSSEMAEYAWLRGEVLPNVPRLPPHRDPPNFHQDGPPTLLFIGLMDYLPNEEAVVWFLENAWPQVTHRVGEARLVIAGKGSLELLKRLPNIHHVDALGVVPSLAVVYARATAAIVPMRSGGGSNIKALEPYYFGRMTIATPRVRAAHGDVLRDGKDILTANDGRTFAEHCIRVLEDPAQAEVIAESGYQRIRCHLNETVFRQTVDRTVHSLMNDREREGVSTGRRSVA